MTPTEVAEVIAQIVNVKTLEIYRAAESASDLVRAHEIDRHLADLGTRIVEGLELLEDNPSFELGPYAQMAPGFNIEPIDNPPQPNDLPASTTGGQESAIDAQPEAGSEPVGAGSAGDHDTQEPPGAADEPADPNESQTPSAGGELDTDGPVCVDCGGPRSEGSSQRCRECYRARAEAKKPPVKMSGKRKPSRKAKAKAQRHPIADLIEAYLATEKINLPQFSDRSGVNYKTLHGITSGRVKRPEAARIKAIEEFIRAVPDSQQKPDASPAPSKPKKKPAKAERVNGSHSITDSVITKPPAAPRGAIQFLQLQVGKYLKENGCSNGGAAAAFGIPITALEALDNGHLPSTCSIARIAARIPEVEANRRVLFEARRRQEERT